MDGSRVVLSQIIPSPRQCPGKLSCDVLYLSRSGSSSAGAPSQPGVAVPEARRRAKNGQALMPMLKFMLRIAGPKIFALLALAMAKTALSNRLARLQVCTRVWAQPGLYSPAKHSRASTSRLCCPCNQYSCCVPMAAI